MALDTILILFHNKIRDNPALVPDKVHNHLQSVDKNIYMGPYDVPIEFVDTPKIISLRCAE